MPTELQYNSSLRPLAPPKVIATMHRFRVSSNRRRRGEFCLGRTAVGQVAGGAAQASRELLRSGLGPQSGCT
eukprot:scaffold87939_cov19-Tisochrysis_lutea.AAC.1